MQQGQRCDFLLIIKHSIFILFLEFIHLRKCMYNIICAIYYHLYACITFPTSLSCQKGYSTNLLFLHINRKFLSSRLLSARVMSSIYIQTVSLMKWRWRTHQKVLLTFGFIKVVCIHLRAKIHVAKKKNNNTLPREVNERKSNLLII